MTDLPECKYRRFTRRLGSLRLHCFLKRDDCTHEECVSCLSVTVEQGRLMTVETENGQTEEVYFSEVPDPNFAAVRLPLVSPEDLPNWIIEHSVEERPDLQVIRTSLPPHRPGKDRYFTMESDGSIVYEQEEGEWEPPRDIKGYQRDPENSRRFTPLWPKCLLRIPRSHRSESCGCIQVAMKCLNLDSELNGEKVTHEQCQQCPVRDSQEGD